MGPGRYTGKAGRKGHRLKKIGRRAKPRVSWCNEKKGSLEKKGVPKGGGMAERRSKEKDKKKIQEWGFPSTIYGELKKIQKKFEVVPVL